jgi:hypothetical protein
VHVHMCVCLHTFTSTQAFRGNIVQTAVVPSVLNAGNFQRQYDLDFDFFTVWWTEGGTIG